MHLATYAVGDIVVNGDMTNARTKNYASAMYKDANRRSFLVVSGAAVAWLLSPAVASAQRPSISAGAPCKVAGRERTVNGVTFVCTKSKGKLAWRRKKFATVDQVVTARVLDSAALALGASAVVDVALGNGASTGVVVTRSDSGLTALRVNCTHQGFPVARVKDVLECELHGSQFDPVTGSVVTGPATRPLLRYEATESDGSIFVTVRPS